MSGKKLIPITSIQKRIFTFRSIQVMIDRDLAELYGVEVKRLNEQVKRNISRFPKEFRFQLTDIEKNELIANCDRFKMIKHSSVNPYAFTEQGVAMLSAVLRSETAVKVSVQIIQAFVEIKKFKDAHDRFLIIDEEDVYHFGASLKDLGKKWFAFSKMDISSVKVMDKLK